MKKSNQVFLALGIHPYNWLRNMVITLGTALLELEIALLGLGKSAPRAGPPREIKGPRAKS